VPRRPGLRGFSLTTRKEVTATDIDADGKTLIVITGANEGGKSTFPPAMGGFLPAGDLPIRRPEPGRSARRPARGRTADAADHGFLR